MSTFYVVLYIFIAVVVLLCVVSFFMYLCRAFGRSKEYDEEEFFTTRGRNLNTTATTEIVETTQLMTDGPSDTQGGGNIELVNVRQRVDAYEHGQPSASSVQHKPVVAPRPVSIAKPIVPAKPMIHSQGPSVVKPNAQPPPPPAHNQVEVAVVHPQHLHAPKPNAVKKPKAPPPPPPDSVYENVNKSDYRSPPPNYDDVMVDIPVDNYLSDND